MNKQNLLDYFSVGIKNNYFDLDSNLIGAEIETHFVDKNGRAITQECSQQILGSLIEYGWLIVGRKGSLITELKHSVRGNIIRYELGRQNLELSTIPYSTVSILMYFIEKELKELYKIAEHRKAYPFFSPIIESDENLLIIPDERDASWLKLDGKKALNLLARTASVQFTILVRSPQHGIKILNKLSKDINQKRLLLTNPYPQEKLWKEYIKTSNAKYREDRYGIVRPKNINEYVDFLSLHDVVENGKLIPFSESNSDINLFLRSIWWKFRLRRYNNNLCIEIRTFARRDDSQIAHDLQALLKIFY